MSVALVKMRCPKCGAEMNLHAQKIVYRGSGAEEGDAVNEGVMEFHACPQCGAAASGNVAA